MGFLGSKFFWKWASAQSKETVLLAFAVLLFAGYVLYVKPLQDRERATQIAAIEKAHQEHVEKIITEHAETIIELVKDLRSSVNRISQSNQARDELDQRRWDGLNRRLGNRGSSSIGVQE